MKTSFNYNIWINYVKTAAYLIIFATLFIRPTNDVLGGNFKWDSGRSLGPF
jgi:hypothetical protein